MSKQSKKQEASATPTPLEPSPPPPPAEVITDAEVVAAPPPRVHAEPPRTVAKPLEASKVFDADVSDAKNAAKGAPREPGAAPEPPATKQRRTKKTASADEEVEPTDLQLAKARNYVSMADGLHRMGLKARYQELLDPASLADLDARLKLQPEQVDVMALPLAEGLARHGAMLPWYVELGIGALGVGMARASVCKRIEDEYQRQQKAKAPK